MKGQEIKAEERDAIFGESPLGYVIFEETSLKKRTVLIGNPIFGESFP